MVATVDMLRRAFRASLEPPEQITPSEWAKHRVLGPEESAQPGPLDLDVIPYARGILDALGDREHRQVAFMSAPQVAKSLIGQTWQGWLADVAPVPVLIVFPDEKSARETVEERLVPMIRNTPRLARLRTGRAYDMKSRAVKLRTCSFYVGWASSAQTLATRPVGALVLEEVDKPDASPAAGREGDWITLADLRLSTFKERGKRYASSTPTNRHGAIWKMWEASPDRRRWHLPCPLCGFLQTLEWGQLRYEGRGSTDMDTWRRLSGGAKDVRYECASCRQTFDESHKPRMQLRGQWISEGYPPGQHPVSEVVAFHLSGMASPFVTWAQIVREHYAARLKGPAELHGWVNGRLGWIAEEEEGRVHADVILRRALRGHPARIIPAWATAVLTTADTQHDGWKWVTRSWGKGYVSRLLAFGHARTLEELRHAGLASRYPLEGIPGVELEASKLLVDAAGLDDEEGTAQERVYRFAATDPERIIPTRGHGGRKRPASRLREQQGGQEVPEGVVVWVLDTQSYKDLLASRICQEEPEVWQVTPIVTPDYAAQLASEHKVLVRPTDTERRWVPIVRGSPNHLWDAEAMQGAAADMAEVDTLEPLVDLVRAEVQAGRYRPRDLRADGDARPRDMGRPEASGDVWFGDNGDWWGDA